MQELEGDSQASEQLGSRMEISLHETRPPEGRGEVHTLFLRSLTVAAANQVAETQGCSRLLSVLVWLLSPGSRLRAAIRR